MAGELLGEDARVQHTKAGRSVDLEVSVEAAPESDSPNLLRLAWSAVEGMPKRE